MTISAYDRHGSEDVSALSEEQVTEQLDAGDQIASKPSAPKKPRRANKTAVKKSGGAKKSVSKKATTKKAGPKKTLAKKTLAKKKAVSKKAVSGNSAKNRQAAAADHQHSVLLANARLRAFLDAQGRINLCWIKAIAGQILSLISASRTGIKSALIRPTGQAMTP